MLNNKVERRVHMRVPRWVNKKAVRCQVGGREAPLVWLNNYLLIDGLSGPEVIVLTIPVVKTVARFTEPAYGITYTLKMKGNTLVDISPRPTGPPVPEMEQDVRLTTRIA